MDNSKKKVDEKATALHAEKKKRSASAVNLADERKAVDKTGDEFHDWIDELNSKLSDAKLAEKEAKNRMKFINPVMELIHCHINRLSFIFQLHRACTPLLIFPQVGP